MPRPTRIDFPGLPQHIIVRGNDRNAIFFCDEDRSHFLKCLGEARAERACDIHAFVLMTNHVHVLATGRAERSISRMMQDLGRAYVGHVNKRHARTGALYEGRFKSSVVETTRYFLACMRYIEMNPVRAGMVTHPALYDWSSHGQNITGDPGGLVMPHPEYLQLGRTAGERARAYARLLDQIPDEDEIAAIRQGARQGKAVGSDLFREGLEGILRRRVDFVPRGRPRRSRVICPLFREKGL